MLNTRAPLSSTRFLLFDVLDAPARLAELPGEAVDRDLIEAIVEEIARLCAEELVPINRDGDEIGCVLTDGAVQVPPGFKSAYDAFVEGGWIGVALPAEFGGQGLPFVLNVILHETIMAANLSFGDYIGLPQAAAKTIAAHADPALRDRYLEAVVTGSAGATMCMTEPQCGTDLGLISTRAEPAGDGSYRLHGTKIFISAGDHDLTDDIVHLVLARLPDAPAGVRGLSLFLCPKNLDDGTRNAVSPVRLERKMGYKAASTCEMHFDGATAWLVGEANRGLPAMFTMVNTARLLVALQGLGTAEAAYQAAAAYARDRRQGRALAGPVDPDARADPLIVHPDVRRMLLRTRAFTEAGRMIALWFGLEMDVADRHADPAVRQSAADLIGLLTPVVKASFSDLGFQACNDCMQIFGGHGYIRDTGVEQLVRDARIAQIQEGANGVQALDLIGRKLGADGGRAWQGFAAMVRGEIDRHGADPRLSGYAAALGDALDKLGRATDDLLGAVRADRDMIGAAGVDYQRAFALVLFGWAWLRIAAAAADRGDDPHCAASLHVAAYFFARELPAIDACLSAAASGSAPLMAMPAELF